jgi:hypothetical protein
VTPTYDARLDFQRKPKTTDDGPHIASSRKCKLNDKGVPTSAPDASWFKTHSETFDASMQQLEVQRHRWGQRRLTLTNLGQGDKLTSGAWQSPQTHGMWYQSKDPDGRLETEYTLLNTKNCNGIWWKSRKQTCVDTSADLEQVFASGPIRQVNGKSHREIWFDNDAVTS